MNAENGQLRGILEIKMRQLTHHKKDVEGIQHQETDFPWESIRGVWLQSYDKLTRQITVNGNKRKLFC